jgi:glucuronoarabinoxylan endo-1,4-beta-xylanase
MRGDLLVKLRLLSALSVILLSVFIGCGGGYGGGSGGGGGTTVPAAPAGVTVTPGNSQVMLSWSAAAGATGYYANRATVSGGPYTQLAATANTTFTDTALTNGTNYYYVITAYNSAGIGARSSEVHAIPLLAGPTGLLAASGDAHVTLTWNVAANATSYNVKRSLTPGGPYTTVGSPTTSSFNNSGLANGTTYYYVVTAMVGAVESSNSSEVNAKPALPVAGSNAAVDFGTTLQTIRGFGGSTAFIGDMNSHAGQADALFGNTGSQQIGLSILRVRIDPTGFPNPPSNWTTELNNAKGALLSSQNTAIVFATPWSPPASMKSNNNVNNGGNLNQASYAGYATYLESFVTFMQNGGAPLYAISMQNEPDFSASYESCIWNGTQMHDWIAGNAAVLTTKLIMPEAVNLTPGSLPSLADPSLADASAASHISIIGTHLYGTAPGPYANAASHGKDLWMTEHSISDPGLQGALELAKEIHDSMTVGNYNAYVYWWMQDWIVGNSSPYLDGLINDPAIDNKLTQNGYVMGQFAKFVRPGYVRATAAASPTTNVFVSAYTGSGHFVIVAINLGATDVSQPFTISGATVTTLTPFRTSATENLAQQSAVSVTGGTFSYTLPGLSVTTFVQ